MLPPTTATDVQMVCPIVAPIATPIAFLCVASCKVKNTSVELKIERQMGWKNLWVICSLTAIVAIWLRSPHSARNVRINDCKEWNIELSDVIVSVVYLSSQYKILSLLNDWLKLWPKQNEGIGTTESNTSKNIGVQNLEKKRRKDVFPCPLSSFSST